MQQYDFKTNSNILECNTFILEDNSIVNTKREIFSADECEILIQLDINNNSSLNIFGRGLLIFENGTDANGLVKPNCFFDGAEDFEGIYERFKNWKISASSSGGSSFSSSANPIYVVGLGNVDNTSDLDKPISNATQNALNSKVDKIIGKTLSTNDFDNIQKTKLDAVNLPQKTVLSANFVAPTTTLTNTPLFFSAVAGGTYRVEVFGLFSTAVQTTGISLGVFNTGVGVFNGSFYVAVSTNPVTTGIESPLKDVSSTITSSGVLAANSAHVFKIEFVYIAQTSGNVGIRFGSEIANSAVTLLTNSILIAERK